MSTCIDCGRKTPCIHPRLGPMCPTCQDGRAVALRCLECGATGTMHERRWTVCSCDAPLDRVFAADEGDVCACRQCA